MSKRNRFNYLSKPTFDELMAQATEVGQILGGLRLSVERRRDHCAGN